MACDRCEWASAAITPDGPSVSIVGNVMRHGASTQVGLPLVGSNSCGRAFLEDNVALDQAGAPVDIASTSIATLEQKPAWPDGLVALPSSSVLDSVLAHADARPKDRDVVDQRIVMQVMTGTGAIIDSEAMVGGYPHGRADRAIPLEVPTTNIEAWLDSFAAELE